MKSPPLTLHVEDGVGTTRSEVASLSGPQVRSLDRGTARARARAAPRSGGSPGLHAASRALRLDLLFFLLVGASLLAGWHVRHEEYLTAESGLWYSLGVVGTTAMLLLLLYPLRSLLHLPQGLFGLII